MRRGSGRGGAASALRSAAASAVTTETLVDFVERLGLVDMVLDKVRTRLQEVDVDEFLDEATDYLRRNPEVVVVLLATITVGAGAMVFLSRFDEDRPRREERDDDADDREMEVPRVRETPSRSRVAAPSPSGTRRRPSAME